MGMLTKVSRDAAFPPTAVATVPNNANKTHCFGASGNPQHEGGQFAENHSLAPISWAGS